MIEKLEDLWWGKDFNSYLYHLRANEFKIRRGYQLLNFLQTIEVPEGENIDKELVKKLWMIPLFIELCKKKMDTKLNHKDYANFIKLDTDIRHEIQRILGMP
ncbi:MAG: hypothetical protein AAF960_24960 [Bacteroidota bacterium]